MQPEDNLTPNVNSSSNTNPVPAADSAGGQAPIVPNLVPDQTNLTSAPMADSAGASSADAVGGYAASVQNGSMQDASTQNTSTQNAFVQGSVSDMNFNTGQAPVDSGGANDLMGAGVISPTDTGSFMQEPTPAPEPAKKGGAKKILALVGVVVVVLVLVLGAALFYLKSQRTSAQTLKTFSDSTSALTDEGTDLSSAISKTTYASSTSTESVDLEADVKAFDEAVTKFEDATKNLKSDKKALKDAAFAYITEIKSYKKEVISLAVDNAKIQAVMKNASGEQFAATSGAAAFATEADRVSAIYIKAAQDLKDLSLSNETAKQLRDLYIAFLGEMQTSLKNMKEASNTGNRTALLEESSKVSELARSHPAIAKENEVEETLSINGDAYKKLEDARAKLNEEIAKVRY